MSGSERIRMQKAAWGVDAGTSSVKAVRLQDAGGCIEITDIQVVDLRDAGPQPASDAPSRLRTAIRDALQGRRADGDAVVCGLPCHTFLNRLLRLPRVEPDRVAEVVQLEARRHVPSPLDEVLWAFQRIEREDHTVDEMEVALVAVKAGIVRSFVDDLASVGVAVDRIQFPALALYNFMTHMGEGRGSVALDMGARNTDLVVIDGERSWARSLTIAGDDLTLAVAKEFKCPFHEAEKLKVGAGESLQARRVFEAVQPALKQMADEIQRSIEYYTSQTRSFRQQFLLLAGGSSRMFNLGFTLARQLHMEVIKIANVGSLAVSARVSDHLTSPKTLPSLCVAIGLALQGLGCTRNQTNLLSPDDETGRRAAPPFPAEDFGDDEMTEDSESLREVGDATEITEETVSYDTELVEEMGSQDSNDLTDGGVAVPDSSTPLTPYLGFDEALERLGVSESDLKRLMDEGEVRAFADGGRILCRADDVESLKRSLSRADAVGDRSSPMTEAPLVFISAKTEDYAHARQVYEGLRSRGIQVFLSPCPLPESGRSDSRRQTDDALDQARHMIVVTSSRKHVESMWVEAEWGLFVNEKRSGHRSGNLVTVVFGSMGPRDLPPSLRHYEVVPWDAQAIERLLLIVSM